MICLAGVGCFGSASTVIYVQASHPVNCELQVVYTNGRNVQLVLYSRAIVLTESRSIQDRR
jgi:hypothetical protein